MSNHIVFTKGTAETIDVDLVDQNGDPYPLESLVGATAQFLLRVQPSDTGNVLDFTTTSTPASLAFQPNAPALSLSFVASDTSALALGLYYFQMMVTLADGSPLPVIEWSPFELTLGGAATTPIPPFDNVKKVDQDYQLPGDLAYFTPGGSPIQGAQIRLYYKSDYDAGNLASPIGVTMTDASGGWINPILVVPGFTFIVRFEKPNEWGPDTVEIVA